MKNHTQKRNHARVILFLLAMSTLVMAVVYFGVFQKKMKVTSLDKIKIDGVVLPKATPIKNFSLTNQDGNAFTQDNLKGKWTMLFFGFTNCGYVCPTTMVELNKMYRQLKEEIPDNQLPQIVLTSVDPERDSAERMKDYVQAYNPNFIGLRSDPAQTQLFAKQLHISAVKMQAEGQDPNHYMINHSAEILLINPKGEVQAYLSFPHKAEQLVKDYKLLLTAYS